MKKAIIAGAGPAGLTAALELLKNTDIQPIVYEASDQIGGISQTVNYKGNRIDIGGHRFFSKEQAVMDWWADILPVQGKPSKDDILLGLNDKDLSENGPDPEKEDKVILIRHRISRIFFLHKFFDYPISMKKDTFLNMGFANMVKAGFGYLWSCVHKLPEDSLENFYINRFGRPLYEMFFEGYTEKVWGVHPSKLGADWGSQRVKGLSIMAVLKDMVRKTFGKKDEGKVETSLIEQFIYPKLGPGQLWETVADKILELGGEIHKNCTVEKVYVCDGNVKSVTVRDSSGNSIDSECDFFLSTMPVKDLVASIDGVAVPERVKDIAANLPYRDFITVGLCLDGMKISNETKVKTFKNRIPDTWIYIQDKDVRVGRLQVFNNWSPYMVGDYENNIWVGMEYFCNEGDQLWEMDDASFIDMAIGEMEKIGMIDSSNVIDSCRIKIKKAYPAYFGSYYQLDEVKSYLDGIHNLFCLGRNGQHRYNNMDHSMMTAIKCVKSIKDGNIEDKAPVWNVNTDTDYHETKQS